MVPDRPHGKWSDPRVPHKGLECIGVDECEDLTTCEMCETAEIRYAHHMQHQDYPTMLTVGRQCAEHMEEDYVRPREREARVRATALSKKRWLTRQWKLSAKGHDYLKTRDGVHVVIWPNQNGTWGGKVTDTTNDQAITSKKRYESKTAVKLAAFNAMQVLKQRRDQDRPS